VQKDLNDLLGVDIDKLVNAPDDDFISQLIETAHNSKKNLKLLADLLSEMAPYQQDSNTYYKKSLLIYKYIMAEAKFYSLELIQKISTIQQYIN
jgi:hypothetical protein